MGALGIGNGGRGAEALPLDLYSNPYESNKSVKAAKAKSESKVGKLIQERKHRARFDQICQNGGKIAISDPEAHPNVAPQPVDVFAGAAPPSPPQRCKK
ncbi:MAG: hypothetical protein L6R35_007570 [Caloplaca aegaea]|nr:MAG: hypothetical protein L6R35_007570 [Caloplaca aegaea]